MLSAIVWLAVLGAEPEGTFAEPRSPDPEYGHALTAEMAQQGWVSLFDGQTTFGWDGSTVKDGQLSGGVCATALASYDLRADVAAPGAITLGGERIVLKAGMFERSIESDKPACIELASGIALRSLLARPRRMTPLFNDRDLTGCRQIIRPGRPLRQQARWSVTEGVIRGQGGPGAMELPGQYGDLVLQLDARARGALTNGGVFVRAIPGDFMNGYETQVFNACYEGDPNRPARYSTGGIDDRQLARRLVSRDGHWFTMTVVAVGPHLSTWVNGAQMTDWTDTRALHENPREGLRLSPGSIQLQSHDPATDVEFRQIRVGL